LISTDTPLQGIYGYALDTAAIKDAGVVLLSYTWEDDANKLLADQNDKELVRYCLKELDTLLARCGYPAMSDYVDHEQTAVIHWSHQPTARGCAKLYRQRTWSENHALLTYNQVHSRQSNLYFAGEAFSLEGGWTEPALRLGIDAALHLLHKDGAEFLHGFNFERDYPKYPDWEPPQK
jgi:tryptophan 2-monooxygenase